MLVTLWDAVGKSIRIAIMNNNVRWSELLNIHSNIMCKAVSGSVDSRARTIENKR